MALVRRGPGGKLVVISDSAEQEQSLLVEVEGLLFVSEGIIRVSNVDQSVGLAITIGNGAVKAQGLRAGVDRLLLLAEMVVGDADIIERGSFV